MVWTVAELTKAAEDLPEREHVPVSATDFEERLYIEYSDLLDTLLQDQTTGTNIFWATDSYADRGPDYQADQPILAELIIREKKDIIRPRSIKAKEEQQARTRKRAEVFTPGWICRQMIDALDDAFFDGKPQKTTDPDRPSILERAFPENKTWKDYVNATYLEITCGEAPFLVSRYDSTTGEPIQIDDRFGVLDRKLQLVNAHTKNQREWVKQAYAAYKATYGYELQGDNLILARENLLYTFIEYYIDRWQKAPTRKQLRKLAEIISWNIWQMDGLTGTVPHKKVPPKAQQLQLGWSGEITGGNTETSSGPMPCIIRDWSAENEDDKPITVEFRQLGKE